MREVLQKSLEPFIKEYDDVMKKWSEDPSKPAPDLEARKNLCLTTIEGHMEALSADDPEYAECSFIMRCLKNGWLVSDIMPLSALYDICMSAPFAFKEEGKKIAEQIESGKIDTLDKRFSAINTAQTYMVKLMKQYGKYMPAIRATTGLKKRVFPPEYPQDQKFGTGVPDRKPEEGIGYTDAATDNSEEFNALMAENARANETYIFDEINETKRQTSKAAEFVPNDGQRYNKMTIPASRAVSEVIGDAVYDEIEEMSRGKLEDRKVPLHHAMGTKNHKKGHHVLEMEFAGTNGEDVIKKHRERNGGVDQDLSPKEYQKKYGTRAKKPGSDKEFKFIHYKDSSVTAQNGIETKKMRYTFGGPNLVNVGEYSIENTREYARYYAEQFLKPLFDNWRLAGIKPNPIHIDLNGHSRGAVTAGQTAKLINQWVKKYAKQHHMDEKKLQEVMHYDLRLYDPVPGVGTNIHLGSCNLRDIPNMNATVFCSLGIEAPDFAFPLQHVKGAKKIVLGMTDHAIGINQTDESQKSTIGDGRAHMKGYYDAETGEMYRGSGLSELPDGVYVMDENNNLIRMTSYSQVNELFGKVYDKTSPQRIRARRINEMVRDWFCENHLKMSFPDERTRKLEEAKNDVTQSKILEVDADRIKFVKEEIRKLRELKQNHASKETIVKQNEALIKACRDYMKDTTMPPYGETARKVGLVADTLSFTMRENNQLNKEIKLEKGEPVDTTLDDKIKAHKERMENKDGYLKRKQEAEAKRLKQENRILKLINVTKQVCQNALKTLDATRVGKSGSDSYNKFHKALEEGAKLNKQVSVRDLDEYYKRLKKVSDDYTTSHDVLLGPVTDDGALRIGGSKVMSAFGKKAGAKLQEISAVLDDKKVPIGLKMSDRTSRMAEMKAKEEELRQAGMPVEPAQEEIVNPVAGPVL